MIITQTPVRISFLGGGTDYPAHFRQWGGATLTATIDRYSLITVHADPVVIGAERRRALEERLLLLYTGIQRHAHVVLEEQLRRTAAGENRGELDELKALVDPGVRALCEGRLAEFGELLHQNW